MEIGLLEGPNWETHFNLWVRIFGIERDTTLIGKPTREGVVEFVANPGIRSCSLLALLFCGWLPNLTPESQTFLVEASLWMSTIYV